MHNPHRHHFGHWMRHMASVPKGFLKYSVLKLLNEKPRSGSEIMSEIEKQSDSIKVISSLKDVFIQHPALLLSLLYFYLSVSIKPATK